MYAFINDIGLELDACHGHKEREREREREIYVIIDVLGPEVGCAHCHN